MHYLVYDNFRCEEYNYKVFLGVFRTIEEVSKIISHYAVYNYRVNDTPESIDDMDIKVITIQTDDYDKLSNIWERYDIYTRSGTLFQGWTYEEIYRKFWLGIFYDSNQDTYLNDNDCDKIINAIENGQPII